MICLILFVSSRCLVFRDFCGCGIRERHPGYMKPHTNRSYYLITLCLRGARGFGLWAGKVALVCRVSCRLPRRYLHRDTIHVYIYNIIYVATYTFVHASDASWEFAERNHVFFCIILYFVMLSFAAILRHLSIFRIKFNIMQIIVNLFSIPGCHKRHERYQAIVVALNV